MKRLLFIIGFLFALSNIGLTQTATFQSWCEAGNTTVSTQGLNSTNKVQGSWPQCLVTVFIHGSSTPFAGLLAADCSTPKANPFAANTNGQFLFCAPTANLYDVSLGPNPSVPATSTMPPTLLTGVNASGGGGGGGGGTVTNNGNLTLGNPIYGNGAAVVQAEPTELNADVFPGATICSKILAAVAQLGPNGGIIKVSNLNYPACTTPLILPSGTRHVTLEGAGPGNIFIANTGGTIINFAPGISGITIAGDFSTIQDLVINSNSTTSGTDDCLTFSAGGPRAIRVGCRNFGRNGFVWMNNTDSWHFEDLHANANRGIGFFMSPGCTDQNVGFGVQLNSTNNGGLGYDIECGGGNYFLNTHAFGNLGGAWFINTTYSYYINPYVENDGHSSFTLNAGTAYNQVQLSLFGQPTPLIDNGIYGTNQIIWQANGGTDGVYPAVTTMSLTGKPQSSPGAFYSWIADTNGYGLGDLILRDRTHATNVSFYAPGRGWGLLAPVTIGLDNVTQGSLSIANGAQFAHTTFLSGATSTYVLTWPTGPPPVNGYALVGTTTGILSWAPGGGGGGGGNITSINTDVTPAQQIIAGSNITVVDNGAGGHTISSTAGGGNLSGSLTSPLMPKASGVATLVDSSVADNGTTVSTTEPFSAATVSTGSSPPTACGSATGCIAMGEAAGLGTPTSGVDYIRADSATHGFLCSFNGASETSCAGSAGSVAFNSVTTGTNANALHVGTGGTLDATGSGTISATQALSLTNSPALCPTGQAPTGIAANGNATGCAALGVANSAGNNVVPKSDGTNLIPSAIVDNGTTVASTEPITAPSLSLGTSPPTACGSATACWAGTESATAGTPTASVGYMRWGTGHNLVFSFNNGAEGALNPASGGSGVANTATHTLGSSNQNWATLGTGVVKNTTTTGALSNAASADIIGLFSSCSGTQYLGADGTCHTASGSGTVTASGTPLIHQIPIWTTATNLIGLANGTTGQFLGANTGGDPSWQTPSGAGTVTSAAFTGDGTVYNASVTGSPITTTGTFAPSLHTQSANTIFAGPTTGSAAAPTFRALVTADLPTATSTKTACTTDIGPVTADDNLITILNPSSAVHITRFSCGVTGTTSVIGNLTKATLSLIADATCTAGDANQVVVTAFVNGSSQCGGTSSCAVAAHAPVVVHLGTISGTPTGFTVCVDYTVD